MIHLLFYCFSFLFITIFCVPLPARCQKSYDPNLQHFFMGRQQITVEDNSPIINNRTGDAAGGGGNGALLNRAVPLPKSGWQPYAPVETPGINPNLPKVPGPVHQSHTAAANTKTGNKGHAGHLAAGAHGKTSSANNIRSYSPYTKYPAPAANTEAQADLSTSTHVKGSLLHWARRTRQEQ
jgi:hypothetical protein